MRTLRFIEILGAICSGEWADVARAQAARARRNRPVTICRGPLPMPVLLLHNTQILVPTYVLKGKSPLFSHHVPSTYWYRFS